MLLKFSLMILVSNCCTQIQGEEMNNYRLSDNYISRNYNIVLRDNTMQGVIMLYTIVLIKTIGKTSHGGFCFFC